MVNEPPLANARSRRARLLLVLIVVAAIVALATWWSNGGTYLSANGGGIGAPAPVGEPESVGIDLVTSSGPSVMLDAATAPGVAGVRVSWSVYRNRPHQAGFGSWLGPLAPTYSTAPVRGYRVAQPADHPERGATWLVMTVVASRPGVYHIHRINISYHSGLRSRHTTGNVDLCLLAYPPADKTRILTEVAAFQPAVTSAAPLDPLVAQYESCLLSRY
jgi:hypothetical protein